MPKEEETYCRLCAEPTPEVQMIKPTDDVAMSSQVETKMLWINIDVSETNYLPKSICFSCFDLLERTWKFLHAVRSAQQKLNDVYAKKIELPLECEVKPVNKLNEAGKPVDKGWEDFKNIDTKIKLEVPIQNIDEITCIDPQSLLNYAADLKCEPDDDCDDASYEVGVADDMKDCSDSDEPLMKHVKVKRSKKIKKKKKKKKHHIKEEIDDADLIPNPEAEAVPLDMSLYNMTWLDYTWRCANCDAQCKSVESLRLHSLEIHSSCCIFKCSDCHKVSTNFKAFVSHVRIHNNSLRYCCEFCNKNYPMIPYIKHHRNVEHNSLLCCQNCGTLFETEEELQDHILLFAKGYRRQKKKKEKMELSLQCDSCQKEFKTASNLKAHKVVHTERAREFSCHICGKMFLTKGTLRTHMAIHDDTKPYKCEFCTMAFRARGNLTSHISLHYSSKPYVCEQCGKSFRTKRHLKSHSIVHTDLMPYVCEYCNKTFRFKTRLNLHLRQHTGSKPYSCIYCQRDFTNGSNYKKHMKRRHNIDTSKNRYHNMNNGAIEANDTTNPC